MKYILFISILVFVSCNKDENEAAKYDGHGIDSVSKETLDKY